MSKKATTSGAAPAPAAPPPEASRKSERLGFFDIVRQIPEDRWDDHRIYIYRRWPRTSSFDAPRYIDQVRHPIDEQWLLEHHGSGRYGLRLNTNQGTIATHVCEVQDRARPPRVSPEEVIDCRENAQYFELWPPPEEKQPPADASAAAVKEMGRLALQAQQRPVLDADVAALYLETAKARDALVTKLAELQRDRTAPPAADPLEIAERVVKLQKDLRGDGAPAAGPSPLQQVNETIALVERLRDLFPSPSERAPEVPAGPAPSPWAEILRALAPGLCQIVAPLGPLLAQYLAGRLAQPPVPPPAPAPTGSLLAGASAPQGAAAPLPPANPQASVAAPPPPAPEGSKEASPGPAVPSDGLALMHILLPPLAQGYDGEAIADSLRVLHPDLYQRLRALGVQGIIQLLRSEPSLWAQIAALEPQLRALAQQFMDYREDDEEPSNPAADTAPAA
jgi:hypothetical protein